MANIGVLYKKIKIDLTNFWNIKKKMNNKIIRKIF